MSWGGWGGNFPSRVNGMDRDPQNERQRAGLGAPKFKPREKSGLQRSDGHQHIVSSSGLGRVCNQQGGMCGEGVHDGTPRVTQGADDETPAKEKKISERWGRTNSVTGRKNCRRKER